MSTATLPGMEAPAPPFEPWNALPTRALFDSELTNLDFRLLALIVFLCAGRNGECIETNEELASSLGSNESSIRGSLGRLELKGYIRRSITSVAGMGRRTIRLCFRTWDPPSVPLNEGSEGARASRHQGARQPAPGRAPAGTPSLFEENKEKTSQTACAGNANETCAAHQGGGEETEERQTIEAPATEAKGEGVRAAPAGERRDNPEYLRPRQPPEPELPATREEQEAEYRALLDNPSRAFRELARKKLREMGVDVPPAVEEPARPPAEPSAPPAVEPSSPPIAEPSSPPAVEALDHPAVEAPVRPAAGPPARRGLPAGVRAAMNSPAYSLIMARVMSGADAPPPGVGGIRSGLAVARRLLFAFAEDGSEVALVELVKALAARWRDPKDLTIDRWRSAIGEIRSGLITAEEVWGLISDADRRGVDHKARFFSAAIARILTARRKDRPPGRMSSAPAAGPPKEVTARNLA